MDHLLKFLSSCLASVPVLLLLHVWTMCDPSWGWYAAVGTIFTICFYDYQGQLDD